ncbi:sulfotransferase family 2 domain-containing protein [Thalassotalea nanhaiensis]|uniref:Sulfotransferase family 2 domain-containing protein n=1 Tax=Thalassotalea nanhaiensis TaxID=3065648 RepID=A0ABY9TMM1_9GAMM|nr:sulfotransferase family 2 domain-containing protein [Colwelliaceae bacterium SQ345]
MNNFIHNLKFKINIYRRYRYWNKANCIFIHVPKAAGTSINLALYGKTLDHYSALEIKDKFPTLFSNCYKFSFVRNPWARALSAYKFAKVEKTESMGIRSPEQYRITEFDSFESFVKTWLKYKDPLEIDFVFQPQFRFLYDDAGDLLVDFIGKVENLDSDMEVVQRKLGMEIEVSHSNKTESMSNYRDAYVDDEMIEIIRTKYKKDIELFNYEF